jgi:hypothetical protein
MPYYKVKVKSFNTDREIWIALQAEDICNAIHKSVRFCTYTNNIFYPIEQSLHEIIKEEYERYMQLGSQVPSKSKV